MTPDISRLYATVDGTWPAAAQIDAGPWTLREGRGGGKRVSAATANGEWHVDDIGAAENAMRMLGQSPLFMIRNTDEALDRQLEGLGYQVIDPVNIWVCPIANLASLPIPPVTAFTIWEPLAIQLEIWAEGGISDARVNVMERTKGPKTSIFGRVNDKPAGTGFCALHDGIAMVHALELRSAHRGKGLGRWMMRAAGVWAMRKGARWMAVVCTQDNKAANGLYQSLKMTHVGAYHYRTLPETEGEKE